MSPWFSRGMEGMIMITPYNEDGQERTLSLIICILMGQAVDGIVLGVSNIRKKAVWAILSMDVKAFLRVADAGVSQTKQRGCMSPVSPTWSTNDVSFPFLTIWKSEITACRKLALGQNMRGERGREEGEDQEGRGKKRKGWIWREGERGKREEEWREMGDVWYCIHFNGRGGAGNTLIMKLSECIMYDI